MDEFGVLTEKYGLKPQGKSAPMAESKRATNTTSKTTSYSSESDWNSNSNDMFFGSNNSNGGFDVFDDVFGTGTQKPSSNGSSFDLDSVFIGSNKASYVVDNDDIFGGMPGVKKTSSFESPQKHGASVDDLLGDFAVSDYKKKSWNGSGEAKKSLGGFDDLLSGFGNSGSRNNGSKVGTSRTQQSRGHSYKATSAMSEDPFVVLESASTTKSTSMNFSDPLEELGSIGNSKGTKSGGLRPPPKPSQVVNSEKVKNSAASLLDELEEFAMGKTPNNNEKHANVRSREVKERNSAKASRPKEAEDVARNNQQKGDDLESFFGMATRSTSAPRSRASPSKPKFDTQVHNKGGHKASQRMPSGGSGGVKKSSSATSFDELSAIFGAASIFGGFDEVEGESEERRKARLGRLQRTHERAARAVADMNQRDRQTQHEQEERRRIAEEMDANIKRWAAGKEGNMRALLSSLQYVLWPECGWEPVSLTDLITSTSVKKVYRKATLCVHPDKVQQKGANLQQKYIAEKVFDILKESWTKFNKEELS